MKICIICSKEPIYNKSWCKECKRKNESERIRTKHGLCWFIYASQNRSCRKRGDEMPTYDKYWFENWLMSQEIFHELYDFWVAGGYKKDDKPSVDRLDDNTSYNENNIRVITWKQNRESFYEDMKNGINRKRLIPIIQLDMSGNLVKEYYSVRQASRETGILSCNIYSCCRGIGKSAGGFYWKRM